MTGIADACDREAAWLATTGDALPSLPAADGGPWDVVQAYWPGARVARMKRGIYVTFGINTDQRPSAARVQPQHVFRLKLVWAVKKGTPNIAEGEQAAFAAALEALFERVRGPFGDKTHGGRFRSVGEVPHGAGWPRAVHEDPEKTIPAGYLAAAVTYTADDLEVVG